MTIFERNKAYDCRNVLEENDRLDVKVKQTF